VRRSPEQAAWIEMLSRGQKYWREAPAHLQEDEAVAFAAFRSPLLQPGAYESYKFVQDFEGASETLRDNKELALEAVKGLGVLVFGFVSDRLKGDRELLMKSLKYRHFPQDFTILWESVSQELRHNKDLIIELVKQDSCSNLFFQAPDHLQADPDVLLAVKESILSTISGPNGWDRCLLVNDCECICECGCVRVPPALYGDKDFVVQAIKQGINCFFRLPGHLQADADVISAMKEITLLEAFVQAPELQLNIAFMQKLSLTLVRHLELESDGCTTSFGFAWLKVIVNAHTISALCKACVTSQDVAFCADYERKTDYEIRRTRSCMRQRQNRVSTTQRQYKPWKDTHKRGGRHKTSFAEDWKM